MELHKNVTTPSVRTTLSFTETEVIEALKCHAEKAGFCFKDGYKIDVLESQRFAPQPAPTRLEVDAAGTEPAIFKWMGSEESE
ncbi:MAG: hypothetical protein IMZ70_01315 [Candidatus Atribacteria bacterium]|nr:hypothetical protein [Candidatus Atribacteria bacterium]MBE3145001.1 hypothetical protein [Planctomycetota bacterium]